jgi:two-component SAPR family response regulator
MLGKRNTDRLKKKAQVQLKQNGKELAEEMISIDSSIKIIFMSGYTQDIIATHGIIDKDICFIQKPFTMKLLDEQLREALN